MRNISKKELIALILLVACLYFWYNNDSINFDVFNNIQTTGEINTESNETQSTEYIRDEWEDRNANRFWDPIREKYVGMRNYQLYLATGVDITDPNQFTYTCWYCGYTSNDYQDFEWDHIIPLYYANEHGGCYWTKERKVEFAHDPEEGINVCRSCNRTKSADGLSEWMPEIHKEEYCEKWKYISEKYDITLDQEDYDVISQYTE